MTKGATVNSGRISERADQDPHGLAITDGRSSLTWKELAHQVTSVADRLQLLPEGSRVAVAGENAVPTLVAHLAGLVAGVGTVAVHRQATPGDLRHELTAARCSALVLGPGTVETAMAVVPETDVQAILHGQEPPEAANPQWTTWHHWTANTCRQLMRDLVERPARPLLVYTSGTTGRAKATPVGWTRPADAENARRYLDALAARSGFPDGPHLVVGPLQHNGPLTSVRHLIAGQPVIVMPHFDAADTLRLISQHGVSSTVMVPTHFTRLLALDVSTRSEADISSLRMVAHTGSACPSEVKRAMIDWFGTVLVESYGGSELGTVARITSDEWLQNPGSVGRAVPPLEIAAYDSAGHPRGPGEVGLLGIELKDGRQVHFVGDEDKTRAAYIIDGVATLGDVGYVDEDGFVFITDRESDMVVSGGVNLYPAECEQVLQRHPDVDEVAVIGLADHDLGEVLHALVVTRQGSALNPSALDAACRRELTAYKCPKTYEAVAELPRNEMGKVDKKSLRRRLRPGLSS